MTSYAFGLLTVRISVLRVIFDVIVVVNKCHDGERKTFKI